MDDEQAHQGRIVPTIKAPSKPTKEQWEIHQATHTPYEPWCKHCVAARANRQNHPNKGRRTVIVPDVELKTDDMIKVSIDYMYFHERVGEYRNVDQNPPQLVMINHNNGESGPIACLTRGWWMGQHGCRNVWYKTSAMGAMRQCQYNSNPIKNLQS